MRDHEIFFEDRSILRCLATFRSDLHMRLYLRFSPSRMTCTTAPYPWERAAKLRGFKDLHVMGLRLIQAGAIGMCAMYLQVFIISDVTLYGEYSSYVKARRGVATLRCNFSCGTLVAALVREPAICYMLD